MLGGGGGGLGKKTFSCFSSVHSLGPASEGLTEPSCPLPLSLPMLPSFVHHAVVGGGLGKDCRAALARMPCGCSHSRVNDRQQSHRESAHKGVN